MKKHFFAVAALVGCSQAYAQSTTDSTLLDNVTVTANRFATKTAQTGKVVITITQKEIAQAGSRDLSQIITELGGAFINGYNGNGGKDKNLYLRGAKPEHTLIVVDGIPVYDASGIGSAFDLRNIPVDQVERVEILRGSQSTLYGSDAIAGVINIITKRGSTKSFAVSATAHYGSFNTLRSTIGVRGAAQKFDYNINLTRLSSDGFSEAQRPADSSRAYEKDGYRQYAVQAGFGVQVNRHLRLQPFLRYSSNQSSLDLDAFLDDKDYTANIKNLQTGTQALINFGKNKLNLQYQLTSTRRNYLDDSIDVRPTAFYRFNQGGYKATEHIAEAIALFALSNSFKLTTGADFRQSNTSFEALQKNVFSPALQKTAYSGDSVNQSQVGVYAVLQFNRSIVNVELGGRLNRHSEYGTNFAFNFNPSVLLEERLKLFANISTGYKTPGLYQLFSEYGNRELKPEVGLNLEAGWQYLSPSGKGSVRTTGFYRNVKDVIAFFLDPATFRSFYINQDRQKDYGFELDGRLNLNEKVQLKALYSFVDGRITTKQNSKDTSFFNLLRRPRHNLNFTIGSQITAALFVNANLNVVGNRNDVYFHPVTFRRNDLVLQPYTLVNVYAEYAVYRNKVKLFADVRNLLNKQYNDIYGYSTAGFNAYGGIRVQW
jgi:vitamin B12 transporter